jgi:hypothetical protein
MIRMIVIRRISTGKSGHRVPDSIVQQKTTFFSLVERKHEDAITLVPGSKPTGPRRYI